LIQIKCTAEHQDYRAKAERIFLMCRSLAIVLLNLVVLTSAAAMLSACNTTAGVGQDVSAAGHAVTNSAEKVKSGM
jgi:predicted small secreted protein